MIARKTNMNKHKDNQRPMQTQHYYNQRAINHPKAKNTARASLIDSKAILWKATGTTDPDVPSKPGKLRLKKWGSETASHPVIINALLQHRPQLKSHLRLKNQNIPRSKIIKSSQAPRLRILQLFKVNGLKVDRLAC